MASGQLGTPFTCFCHRRDLLASLLPGHARHRPRQDRTLVHLERLTPPALVRLDERETPNPLNPASAVQLHDHLKNLAADLDGRAIMLTGNDPAFSADGVPPLHARHHPAVDSQDAAL